MSQVATGRRLAAVALLAASGCNPVFGIEATLLIDAALPGIDAEDVDLDDDFVLDVVDNCDALPNPMQEDQDGDDIGDACDPCPTGSNHNEDGDVLLDGCDNCPQRTNDDQANTDTDALGDACDPNPAHVDRRERFDGFEILRDDWIPSQVEWVVDGDTVKMAQIPATGELGLWNRRVEVSGQRWSIETRVRFDAPLTNDDFAGIRSRRSDGMNAYLCYVQYDDGVWRFAGQSATPANIAITDNAVTIRMYYDVGTVRCDANGLTSPNLAVVPSTMTHPGVVANTTRARFEYIDATSTSP